MRTVGLVILSCILSPALTQRGTEHVGEPNAEWNARMQREQMKALNKQRQEELKKEMLKLHSLATELKDAVEKTDENILSVQVVRKTEEIEKLAKSIRKKMKEAY